MTTLFSTRDADNDEVRAALITAASYHRHSQFEHSLRWLRHAAQLAAQNGQITRSRDLQSAARQLVELVEAPTRRGSADSLSQPLATSRAGDMRAGDIRAGDIRAGNIRTSEVSSPLSSIAATHRSPYPHQGAGGPDDPAQRIRLDSPTEINRPIHTMRTPHARAGRIADEGAPGSAGNISNNRRRAGQEERCPEPPSLLHNATVMAPTTIAQGTAVRREGTAIQREGALIGAKAPQDSEEEQDTQSEVDFHIVEEATRSSNPGHSSVTQPGGFRRSSLSLDPDENAQAAVDDPDDDATTLTTLAPIRVAVLEAADGSARLISIRGTNSAPVGAIQGLLIPVNADERARLRELLHRSDD